MRIIGQSNILKHILKQKTGMDNAKKRNISKIKITVEIDQEINNKDVWTNLFAAKDRGGLILYLYLKEPLFFYYLAFVLICFGPRLDFGYSLERFIEVVLTCTYNLCFEHK